MSPLLLSAIGLAGFFLLVFLGMPIAFAFALVGGIGVYLLKGFDAGIATLGQAPFVWASTDTILPVALFILMGQLVAQAGISTELYAAAHKWVGRLPGGLAMATTLACTAFGACCGVSVAASATFGTIAFPEMQRFNYGRGLSTGCIAAGGSLSSLIPPSAPFIVYGVITQTSIAKLFIAGILPGLLLSSLCLALIYIRCTRNPQLGPPGPSYSWRETVASLKGVVATLILFLLVMGGLFAGVFTPSEAGGMGAFGAFVITIVKRGLTVSALVASLKESIKSTCFIITIITGAMIFANFLAVGGFSGMLSGWVMGLPFSRHLIMICILLMYIPLGMVMDALSMILLTVPILFPIVVHLGFDLVWFGIVTTLLAEMALISPPVAVNCYVVSGVTKVPLGEVFWGVLPFFMMMFVCLMILYAFPQIILFLPGIMK